MKVEPGETVYTAALREMKEESGLSVLDATLRGILSFDMRGDGNHLEVHVFSGTQHTGDIVNSDEMDPVWMDETSLPYSLPFEVAIDFDSLNQIIFCNSTCVVTGSIIRI